MAGLALRDALLTSGAHPIDQMRDNGKVCMEASWEIKYGALSSSGETMNYRTCCDQNYATDSTHFPPSACVFFHQ